MSKFKIGPTFTLGDLHCIIDLETLATEHNAHILQIGAVMWKQGDYNEVDSLELSIDPKETQEGRVITPDTLAWWDRQEPDTRTAVFDGHYKLAEVLAKFDSWLERSAKENGRGRDEIFFWAKGPEFDMNIMQHAYEQQGIKSLNFRRWESIRTAEALLSQETKESIVYSLEWMGGRPHTALSDAIYGYLVVKELLNNS